jgi:tight adherence protein C
MNSLPLAWLRIASHVSFAAGFCLLVHTLALAPALAGQRLGLRGLKRRRALDGLFGWALVEPTIRWVGARCTWLPDRWRQLAARDLALAGDALGLSPEELAGLSLASGVLGGVIGWLCGGATGLGNALIVAGAVGGAALPRLHITGMGADRMKLVNRRLPYAIDVLALAMGAGLDFPGSVRQFVEKAAQSEDALVEELNLMLQGLQLGRTRRQALEDLGERVPSEAVREFVGAVVQAELRGNPIADVLRIQADVARRKRTVQAEERAAKASVAMLAPLLLVFIAILILIVAPVVLQLDASGL